MGTSKEKAIIAIEIGSDDIRLAMADHSQGDGVVICRQRSLPQELMGEETAPGTGQAAQLLRELVGGLPGKERSAILQFNSRDVVCRVERVPEDRAAELATASKERMANYAAFWGREVCAGHIIQDGPEERDRKYLFCAAIEDGLLRYWLKAAEQANIKVLHAEPAVGAVVRVMLGAEKLDKPVYLIVGHGNGGSLGIVGNNALLYCEPFSLPPGQEGRDLLVARVQNMAQYYKDETRGNLQVDRLIFCGMMQESEKTLRDLNSIGLSTALLDPLDLPHVRVVQQLEGGEMTEEEHCAMASTVAGAILAVDSNASMQRISLLPKRQEADRSILLNAWVAVPAIIALLAFAGLWVASWQFRRQAAQVLYALEHPSEAMLECERMQSQTAILRKRQQQIERLIEKTPHAEFHSLGDDLVRRLPEGLWLDRLDLGYDRICFIQGKAKDDLLVFKFVESIRKSPYVKSARVETTNVRSGSLILTQFRVELSVARSEVSQAKGN